MKIGIYNLTGLGDLVALITMKTKLDRVTYWFTKNILKKEDCGCAKRQAYLNKLFPFKRTSK